MASNANQVVPLTGDALRSAVDQYCASTNDAPVERALRKLEAAATLVTEWLDRVNDRDGSALGGPQWFELGRAIAVARAALSSPSGEPAEAIVDPQPEIVGSPLTKIVSYNQMHEEAVEMGYPSILEALEHLDELREGKPTTNTADTPPSGFVELKALYDSQTWAKDWQHNVVPPGKPAQELACAAIRALPELFRLAALTTAPTTGVVDCPICHNNGSDCQVCVGGAMTIEQAAEWLRAQAITTAPTVPVDREAECKPQNRCCVSGWPAGHPFACNDCDPCLFGSHPSEWCPTCGGDQWINDRPCYNCDGSGFRQRLNDACRRGLGEESL